MCHVIAGSEIGGGGELACLICWEEGKTALFDECGKRGLKGGLLNDQLKNEHRSDVV